jgi:hypothetical protein
VRGAARRLARADESVAAHRPTKISGPNRAIFSITSLFVTSSSRDAFNASQTICAA